jgi:hypothetical protein
MKCDVRFCYRRAFYYYKEYDMLACIECAKMKNVYDNQGLLKTIIHAAKSAIDEERNKY